MNKNKVKLAKILTAFLVMAVTAVLATMAWFFFTVRPDLDTGDFQTLEYGMLKLSATADGEDIGLNGEIVLDLDGENEMMYPGASGSMTVWITTDTPDVTSFIMTYVSAEPNADASLLEKARDISERHILFFLEREVVSETPVLDSDGNPVLDSEGNPKVEREYKYSKPFLPVGEYTDSDPVPEYRIFSELKNEVPHEVTLYWVWPYDYAEYGKFGDYNYLFPPDRVKTEEEENLTDAEIYDDEDSYIGKVVDTMRFKFFVNGKRSIDELKNQ